jgi:hypothetical protein
LISISNVYPLGNMTISRTDPFTPQAITATAHKLARIIYRMLTHGEAYVRQGLQEYQKKIQQQSLKRLQRAAAAIGYKLTKCQSLIQVVS